MKNITIYHNPRCSKSREALQLLQKSKKEIVVVEYLKDTLSETKFKQLLKKLKIQPLDLIRQKDKNFKDLCKDPTKLSQAQLLKLLVKNPIIMERPIVEIGNKAIVARPPELIKEII